MQVHVACSSLVIFIYWACERQRSIYHAVRLGLVCGNEWDWKRQVKCKRLPQKKLDINNLQSNMLKQHFAPFCHLLGNISACWWQFIAIKGSCNRSTGGNMVRIKCWVCHFNGTIMVVVHVRLRPLCKWFSVQLSPWSGAFHFGRL